MDLLQGYDVSSDESDTDDKVNSESDLKRTGFEMDFFGLNSDDCDSEGCETQTEVVNYKHSESLGVEIPESEFWRSLQKEDLRQAEENGKRLRSVNEVIHVPNIHKRMKKEINITDNMRTTHNASNKISKHNISKETLVNKQSVISCNDHQKKVFYVHPKLKSLLHSSRRNRPPDIVESKFTGCNGVINRVNWNTQEFSHLFLSASMDSRVRVWNAWSQDKSCVRELINHGKAVKDAEWNSDGRSILSCSYDRTAILNDVETGKCVCKLQHSTYVTTGKFHPVRRNQVVTGSNNSIQHWDVRTPNTPCRVFQYKEDIGQVQDILFTRDGDQFFTCSDVVTRDSPDRAVIAWDFSTGASISNQIFQERYTCTRLKLHPTTGHFLVQTQGGYIALFSINRPYKMVRSKRFESHSLLGYSIGFDVSPDGRQVLSGSSDGKIYCYDFTTGKLLKSVATGLGVCLDVSCHPVLPSTVVCCSWSGQISILH